MPLASEVVAEIAAAESGAVVAETAAQVAILAAASAVQMAETQTAQVVVAAAEQIQQVVAATENAEEDLSWLKQKTQALQTQVEMSNLATLERLTTLETSILEVMTLLRPSPESLSPNPAEPIPPLTPPESAVVLPEVPANPVPAKKRLRRL